MTCRFVPPIRPRGSFPQLYAAVGRVLGRISGTNRGLIVAPRLRTFSAGGGSGAVSSENQGPDPLARQTGPQMTCGRRSTKWYFSPY